MARLMRKWEQVGRGGQVMGSGGVTAGQEEQARSEMTGDGHIWHRQISREQISKCGTRIGLTL